jgi:hypothetical protein
MQGLSGDGKFHGNAWKQENPFLEPNVFFSTVATFPGKFHETKQILPSWGEKAPSEDVLRVFGNETFFLSPKFGEKVSRLGNRQTDSSPKPGGVFRVAKKAACRGLNETIVGDGRKMHPSSTRGYRAQVKVQTPTRRRRETWWETIRSSSQIRAGCILS